MNFLADDKKGKLGEIKSGIDEADVLVTFYHFTSSCFYCTQETKTCDNI